MSAAHEAVDVVQFLLSTGAAADLARSMGTAFAQGLAEAAAVKLDKETSAATQLADALEDALTFIPTSSPLWERAKTALRAAGRFP